VSTVFACGADIKNRFSFYKDGKFYFSSDNGNLENPDNFKRYLDKIKKMSGKLGFVPDIIVHDLHPGYYSTKVEDIFPPDIPRIGVQHHHAHITSVLAKTNQKKTVLGVSFDGTGYGTDDHLWGGEFLVVSSEGFKREAHLKYMKMPGGEKAVYEPWRMTFSLLNDYFQDELFEKNFDFLHIRPNRDYLVMKKMLDKNINLPLTSSCGRLFDAISSLLGITHVVNYEAEAAINLEKRAASSEDTGYYPFNLEKKDGIYIVGFGLFLRAIIDDIQSNISEEDIARRFHNSVARLIVEVLELLREEHSINSVILSGGVFQNKLLYTITKNILEDKKFDLVVDETVPLNDLGICLGQTSIALNNLSINRMEK
jgi:hydrogenase maturation protein HypF